MNIVIYVPFGVRSLEVSGPADVFAEAVLQSAGAAHYSLRILSERSEPILCGSGLRIVPDLTIGEADMDIDTLLVAGPRDMPARPPPRAVIDWLRRRVPAVRRYGAVASGAFILGAAGLLDGKRVTTHWACAADLSAAYPRTHVEPDRMFIRDGALMTCAGATAGIDLALALVDEDYGKPLALSVARHMVAFLKRPGGQSQFGLQLAAGTTAKSPIQQTQAWILDHLQADISVAGLASRGGMSTRNFARAFRRHTGVPPAKFVEIARVKAAQTLLDDNALSLETIATLTGHTSTSRLRRAFMNILGITPAEYRRRF
jgi:transcriptional regulator GlxA family with amidase domain